MAFVHGKNAEIAVDQYIMTGLFKGMEFSVDAETAESTVFGLDDKTYVRGQVASSLSLDGLYDEARDTETVTRFSAAAPFIATAGPGGLAVGSRARLISVTSTGLNSTAGIGDLSLFTWELQSTDRTGLGYALSKPTTVTGTANGATVDTGAAVSGALWVAHFHLHALNATNVVLKIQDSADGVSWADVTSATSGTLSSTGALRVTGTGTVRRYLRVVSTFTGGATTGQFTVAFSRVAP